MSLPPLVEPVDALSDAERIRTARHLSLIPLGELGQRRLRAAHVAIMGAGGLGSPVVLALAAAGVGRLTVIDDDAVELTNLQRQIVHRLSDVGSPKVDSAVRAAADLSPETVVVPVRERLTRESAELLFGRGVDGKSRRANARPASGERRVKVPRAERKTRSGGTPSARRAQRTTSR